MSEPKKVYVSPQQYKNAMLAWGTVRIGESEEGLAWHMARILGICGSTGQRIPFGRYQVVVVNDPAELHQCRIAAAGDEGR